MRATRLEQIQQRAKFRVGNTVQVWTAFDGWRNCEITKLGWDSCNGCVAYHVNLIGVVNSDWLTIERYMKEV